MSTTPVKFRRFIVRRQPTVSRTWGVYDQYEDCCIEGGFFERDAADHACALYNSYEWQESKATQGEQS